MATQNVLMPQMGESIQEGTLTKWHKKLGEEVQREEILFEISTDKVDTEIPSPITGVLIQILATEGQTVNVNSIVAIIDDAATPSTHNQVLKTESTTSVSSIELAIINPSINLTEPEETNGRVIASPLARKIAQEHDVDLNKIQGSGGGNKIVKNDILAALESGKISPLIATAAAEVFAPVIKAPTEHLKITGGSNDGIIDGVHVSRVPMNTMRKKIAEHMLMSKRTSPHVTSVIEIDLQKIVDLRTKYKDKFESMNGFKLSFMPFFLQAAVEAVKAVPIVNASVDGDTIIYKKEINLGVAVALEWGLIVPVIKNATERSFVGLGRELNHLAEKARNKKLAPDNVRGGTFSITNFGGFGTLIGQPIINQPQVAIFGIGAMQKKPVVINDAIAIRTMCHMVLSFDHRIIDGADSGKFLSTVKNFIENWNIPII